MNTPLPITMDDASLQAAPIESYPAEDQAFFKFWYGHMLDDLMQPPLIGVQHSTARYIWNAALAATPPVPAAVSGEPAWLNIETAPKDMQILLGKAPDCTVDPGGPASQLEFVSQGRWVEAEEDAPDCMGHDAGFLDCNFDFFVCARSFGNPRYQHKGVQPTHWMPLPAAPTAVKEGA